VPETTDLERQLQALAVDLHKLEGEYTMYFAGRSARPPVETRTRVETTLRRLDRAGFESATQRFRFGNLQSRFTALAELWDRGMRAKEEGRVGPFGRSHAAHEPPPAQAAAPARTRRVVGVVALTSPADEPEKVHRLYDVVMNARREAGEPAVPYQRFEDLVRNQVQRLQRGGPAEVAFQVTVKDGRVNLTAKAKRGGEP
jgi:hypothetical protein